MTHDHVPHVPAPAEIGDISRRITRVLLDLEELARDIAHVPDMPPTAVELTRDRLYLAAGAATMASVGLSRWPSLQGAWRRSREGRG